MDGEAPWWFKAFIVIVGLAAASTCACGVLSWLIVLPVLGILRLLGQ